MHKPLFSKLSLRIKYVQLSTNVEQCGSQVNFSVYLPQPICSMIKEVKVSKRKATPPNLTPSYIKKGMGKREHLLNSKQLLFLPNLFIKTSGISQEWKIPWMLGIHWNNPKNPKPLKKDLMLATEN